MKKEWLLVAIALVAGFIMGAVACEETPEAGANSPASDFLEVGGVYLAYCSGREYHHFEILAIVNDKWILVDEYEYYRGKKWLNTGQLVWVISGQDS